MNKMPLEPIKNNPIKPRRVATIYFIVYALLFLIFIKYTLASLDNKNDVPFLYASFFALPLGGVLGFIFGKSLAKPGSWIKPILIGMLMGGLALAIVSVYLLFNSQIIMTKSFSFLAHWKDYFVLFGALFMYLLLVIGLWLLPLTGLAALYFNKHFFPRLQSIDALTKPKQQAAEDSDKPHS